MLKTLNSCFAPTSKIRSLYILHLLLRSNILPKVWLASMLKTTQMFPIRKYLYGQLLIQNNKNAIISFFTYFFHFIVYLCIHIAIRQRVQSYIMNNHNNILLISLHIIYRCVLLVVLLILFFYIKFVVSFFINLVRLLLRSREWVFYHI